MMIQLPANRHAPEYTHAVVIHRRRDRANCQEQAHMTWETPQAVDFRFGMEITMYIANR
jgi:coenzyme PQQ precursor peptide PqqA